MRQLSGLLAIGLLFVCGASALALADTASSAESEEAKLKGKVVHIEDGNGKAGSQQEAFSSLTQQGIGNGLSLPVSEHKGEVSNTSIQKGEAETATIDIPLPGKRIEGKAEEAVSKPEIGVDWSNWVSTVADHWYMNLKNLEFRAGHGFTTQRNSLIQYTCYRNGQIGGVILRQSCGNAAYDKLQMEALKRVTPLPPFPEGSKRVTFTLLQGWGSRPRKPGESDFQPGSYGKDFPVERVKQHFKIR